MRVQLVHHNDVKQDLELYMEEVEKLKHIMNELTQENETLKKDRDNQGDQLQKQAKILQQVASNRQDGEVEHRLSARLREAQVKPENFEKLQTELKSKDRHVQIM